MNSMQIKDKVRNIAKKKDVSFNVVFRLYMYDRFIERLSVSKYRDNFVLKGGFYLSTLFGVENRMTMDIDASIKNTTFSEDNIRYMLEEIIKIDINDNALLEIINITTIRDEDEYGGYRITIDIKLENIRETFQIDVATGDPITPSAIIYKYLPTVGDKYINLWAYNIETVLAEKLETILSRVEANSRIRDYYDVFLIYKMYWQNVNVEHFRKAVINTFNKRKFNNDINKTFKIISNSEILKTRWNHYSNKYKYAENIKFDDVIESLNKMIEIIEVVSV